MTKSSKGILGCLLIGVVLFLCCAGSSLLILAPILGISTRDVVYNDPIPQYEEGIIEEPLEPESPAQPEDPFSTGSTIEGSLGYPSEFIPTLEVCAERIDGTGEFCTLNIINDDKYTNGQGYILSVPEGDYYVYSVVLDEDGNRTDSYQAYYSDFVKCGLSVDCTSHEPIPLKILPGIEVQNVDPIDWYAE